MSGGPDLGMETVAGCASRQSYRLPNAYIAPESEAEIRIAGIWREVFNIDRIGLDDDFFDLGGDSAIAITLSVAISDAFGIDFKPSLITENQTVRLVAKLVTSTRDIELPRNVVAMQSSGPRPPLFVVHGQYGITFLAPGFMSGFHDDQPVYIFQVRGFDGVDEPYDSIEEIAADYLRTIRDIQPNGPWFLAAFCSGSWVAVEIARQMALEGFAPDRLVLIDPALHTAMDDEFKLSRGAISGGDIPFLSPLAVIAKRGTWDLVRKVKFFYRTGHWVNGLDRASFAFPAVRDFWVERQRSRLGLKTLRKALNGEANASDDDEAEKTVEANRQLSAAAYASAKLQLAFRTYDPVPVDQPVDLIVSKETARSIEHPAHPLNRFLPNRRLVVSGENHSEAVAGSEPRNARLIQAMVDETLAAENVAKNAGKARQE